MLRDYQIDICDRVTEALQAHRSVMMQMPTGTGKTVVLSSLVRQYLDQHTHVGEQGTCSVLIVAHRMELIDQTIKLLERFGLAYGVIAGGKWLPNIQEVVVASIQTLTQQTNRSQTNLSSLKPSLVIIDEAHHALAKSYRILWEIWPEAKFLGLTATPCRLSGDGFTDLFDVLVESWSVRRFIAEGWLSPFDYYSIVPDSQDQQLIDSLKKRGSDGDYQVKEMHEKLDLKATISRLFDSFARFANNKKGIVYAIDIAHAEHIAEYYREKGVTALVISSQTETSVRQEMIRTFRESNSIQVLVNVDLFSEGFDCPDVEFIQLARPTLSLAKYLQMVGRGLRPSNGKACCVLLDNVGLYRTFGLPTDDRDWKSYFVGFKKDLKNPKEWSLYQDRFLGLGCASLKDEFDTHFMKIISHVGMPSRFSSMGYTGFESKKGRRGTEWIDPVSGIRFNARPKVIDFRGLLLATADSELFFPRIRSKWVDQKHGISRKILETQVGDGLSWQKLYISLSRPDCIYQLMEVQPNGMRVYQDEEGHLFLQGDLDQPLKSESEVDGLTAFKSLCEEKQQAWKAMLKEFGNRFLKEDTIHGGWQLPEGSQIKPVLSSDRLKGKVFQITNSANGVENEFWIDLETGFKFKHCPVVRKRGFVELLFDGDTVFILNIYHERFVPYHNWEIRADDRICTIGNKLYFVDNADEVACRIKKRSGDFQMFVLDGTYLTIPYHIPRRMDLMVINKSGKDLEFKHVPNQL